MFLNINDTFKLMEQLANIAMRQLLDNEAFAADRSLPKPCKTLKNVSALKRSHLLQNRVCVGPPGPSGLAPTQGERGQLCKTTDR